MKTKMKMVDNLTRTKLESIFYILFILALIFSITTIGLILHGYFIAFLALKAILFMLAMIVAIYIGMIVLFIIIKNGENKWLKKILK